MESVLLGSPVLIALITASAALAHWDGREKSGYILQLLSALCGGAALTCAFFAGASLQELIIAALFLLLSRSGAFKRRGER